MTVPTLGLDLGALTLPGVGKLRSHWPALAGAWARQLGAAWRSATDVRDRPLTILLFGLAVGVYAITRFWRLDQFPIYFFTDEAVQTLRAASLVAHGFRDSLGTWLPTYFQNGASYNLSLSVYVQVLPYLLFGKSVVVTRGTSALISFLAALAASLTLKHIFQARWWWLGTLLLAITPAWFLHSRTAFETVIMVAFFACFLYAYLLYRYRSPRYLFPALLFGALAFYAYNGGQFTVILVCLLLLITDLPYHWKNRRTGWWAAVFLGLLALPYVRFTLQFPREAAGHLRLLDLYWLHADLTLGQKFSQFLHEYAFGLSPQYWFAFDNHRDLVRHVMQGYGHISPLTLPFLLIGLLVCLRRVREPAYRVLLIALLAAPVSGAITSVGITRLLVFVVPAVLVTAIGIEALWSLFPWRRWTALAGVVIMAAGSAFGLGMLRNALVNGPTWSSDYGLGGMQWGAQQLFGQQIPAWLARDPQLQMYVSPSWANGTELFPQFFLADAQQSRVQLQGVAYYQTEKRDLPQDLVVVLPPNEYVNVLKDPKFNTPQVEQILPYPDGQPGFYFLHLSYSPQADAVFASEKAALLQPVVETYNLAGQVVTITHPRFGAGQLRDMLDGDTYTLVNAPGFNPMVLDFAFPAARPMSGITLTTGSLPDFTVIVSVYADDTAAPQVYRQEYVGLPADPTIKLDFTQGPGSVVRVKLEIENNADHSPGVNIHVREVQFR